MKRGAHLTVGFWAALTAFVAAVGYSASQVLQVLGIVSFSFGAVLIFGFSLFIATPLLIALLAFHHSVSNEKKFWSHAAVVFAAMYATYVTLVYVVQLTAVIPYGVTNPVLTVTPHSLFWTVDGLGYIFLGMATLFAFPAFENRGLQRWNRLFFLANGLITPIIAAVYFYPAYSIVLLLAGSPWIVTACGSMLLLALYFKNR
ncbi:Uncharacterised protein [uncultured archaeon]|nr:Uncharacterised protein [uncultured archaeon]